MRLRDHLSNQVANKPMQEASQREIKALHDLKAWLHYGWVAKARKKMEQKRDRIIDLSK